MTWKLPREDAERLMREAAQASYPIPLTFQVVAGGVQYTFKSKGAARELRDTLNGMTLEGDL